MINYFRRLKPYIPTLKYFGKWFFIALVSFLVCLLVFLLTGIYKVLLTSPTTVHIILTVLTVLSCIVFINRFHRFVMPFWYIHKVFQYEDDIDDSSGSEINDGEPGAGKTLSIIYKAFIKQKIAWSELLFEFFVKVGQCLDESKPSFENEDEEKAFKTVIDTVEFYEAHPEYIPLLVSNIKIFIGNQRSVDLKKEHLLQLERLPERAVVVFDELAELMGNMRSMVRDYKTMTDNEILNETLSKMRHFGLWWFGGTEQDSQEVYIGMRRVTILNRYLNGLTKVCQPRLFLWFLNWHKGRVLKHGFCSEKRAKKVIRLKQRISKIGFFFIQYEDRGNSQKSKKVKNNGYYCLPLNLPFKYETRGHRFTYRALTQAFVLSSVDSLFTPDYVGLSEDEETKQEVVFWDNEIIHAKLKKNRKEYPDAYERFLSKIKGGENA